MAGLHQRKISRSASLSDINLSNTDMPSDLQWREKGHAAQSFDAKSRSTTSQTPSLPLDFIALSRGTAAGASDGIGMDLSEDKQLENVELLEIAGLRRELAAVKSRRTTPIDETNLRLPVRTFSSMGNRRARDLVQIGGQEVSPFADAAYKVSARSRAPLQSQENASMQSEWLGVARSQAKSNKSPGTALRGRQREESQ